MKFLIKINKLKHILLKFFVVDWFLVFSKLTLYASKSKADLIDIFRCIEPPTQNKSRLYLQKRENDELRSEQNYTFPETKKSIFYLHQHYDI